MDKILKELFDVLTKTEIFGMHAHCQMSDVRGGNIGAINFLTKGKHNNLKVGKPEKDSVQHINPLEQSI